MNWLEIDVSLPSGTGPLPFGPITLGELERRFGDARRPKPNPGPAPRPDDSLLPASRRVEIRLYVSRDSVSSSRAILAVQQITRIFPAGSLSIRIIDVAHEIEAASADRVLFTPTLILLDLNARPTRVLGNLADSEVLVELLRASGLESV